MGKQRRHRKRRQLRSRTLRNRKTQSCWGKQQRHLQRGAEGAGAGTFAGGGAGGGWAVVGRWVRSGLSDKKLRGLIRPSSALRGVARRGLARRGVGRRKTARKGPRSFKKRLARRKVA